MLTSKHHNLNKLVWRYGLISAAAVLLAFGGGASSVKAETPMTSKERQEKINNIRKNLESYPKVSDQKFWDQKWYGTYFKEENSQEELKNFTEERLKEILDLIEKGATKGDKGETGLAGPVGPQGEAGKPGEQAPEKSPEVTPTPEMPEQPGEKAPEKSKEVTPAPEKPADKEANQTPERRNGNMAKTPVANNHRRLPATGEQANPFFTAAAVAVMTTAGVLAVTKRKENN
ncbi:TPA: LPXTG-anchored collagen-like adhesin Scl1/SclA [Streptococcus pyogenes]|nr:LPXTG cell wall anchor domain-containing protein [Streptococcus pyogenes]HEQ4157925.1 LPXTG cell wall anchor domain-containing protein [Streptococcus pyogenes]